MTFVKRVMALITAFIALVTVLLFIFLIFLRAFVEAPFSTLFNLASLLTPAISAVVLFLIQYALSQRQSSPTIIQNAIDYLESTDRSRQQAGIETLTSIDDPIAQKALATAANRQDTTPDVRIGAALGLAKQSNYKDTQAIKGLIEGLGDESGRYRHKARDALREMGTPVMSALLNALDQEKKDVRRLAIGLLGDIGDKGTVDTLIPALRDDDEHIRMDAAAALERIGDIRAASPLAKALQDENQGVRANAVHALQQLPDITAAVPELLNVYKNTDNPNTRTSALNLLAITNHPDVVYELIEVLRIEEDKLVTSRKPIDIIGEAENNPDRKVAKRILAHMGAVSKPLLKDRLHDDDWLLRAGIIEVLGLMKDSDSLEDLLKASNDSETYVRWASTSALGKLQDSRAVPRLIECLDDNQWEVRRGAVSALGEIQDAHAVGPTIRMLNDECVKVQEAAVRTLSDFGTPEALEAVEQWRREREASGG